MTSRLATTTPSSADLPTAFPLARQTGDSTTRLRDAASGPKRAGPPGIEDGLSGVDTERLGGDVPVLAVSARIGHYALSLSPQPTLPE